MVSTVLEVLGAALIVTGATLLAPWLGLVLAGTCLILFALAFDASRSE
jgi:hypothetical protein